MSRADARSRKRHGGLTPVAKNSCRSAIDPIVDVRKDVGCAAQCKPFRGDLDDHESRQSVTGARCYYSRQLT